MEETSSQAKRPVWIFVVLVVFAAIIVSAGLLLGQMLRQTKAETDPMPLPATTLVPTLPATQKQSTLNPTPMPQGYPSNLPDG